MTILTEDTIFKSSSQYRHWFCTADKLRSLRSASNATAITNVTKAVPKLQQSDCLDVYEEQQLVNFYIIKAIELADHCEFPTNVKATAVQFLRRFYLFNSPMTYHPKEIMPCAVFLATKTENHYTSLQKFVLNIPRTTAEQVVAPEFLLTQSLRFTFDVRHPFRALEGCHMEQSALANGEMGSELQAEMKNISRYLNSTAINANTSTLDRVNQAYTQARELLKTSAMLTDVYFTYTPSQIYLGALAVVDEGLLDWYLRHKLTSTTNSELRNQICGTIRQCKADLQAAPSMELSEAEMKTLKDIDKKVYKCRHPDKLDLVSLNRAHKRDGEAMGDNHADGTTTLAASKKRKLAREKAEKEGDDLFGPALSHRAIVTNV